MESVGFKCALLIYGSILDDFDFKELEQYGLVAYRKKGEKVSSVLPRVERDVASFTYTLKDFSDSELDAYINIINRIDFDKYIKRGCDVKIRISVQSDFAQIYFELSNKIISKINELNLDIEFSIISWGGVI